MSVDRRFEGDRMIEDHYVNGSFVIGYNSQFAADKDGRKVMHGECEVEYADGRRASGHHYFGQPHGQWVDYNPDGSVYSVTMWQRGQCLSR